MLCAAKFFAMPDAFSEWSTGQAVAPRLRADLATRIPPARSYIFVLFDGLGDHQLGHPAVHPLAQSRVGAIDASFSTQTTVNTSTMATGLPPSQHGLIAYLLRLNGRVANTIFWFDSAGDPVDIYHGGAAADDAGNGRSRLVHQVGYESGHGKGCGVKGAAGQ